MTIGTQIDEVRCCHEQATAGDECAVQADGIALGERDADEQKRQPGKRQAQRQGSPMASIAAKQTGKREHAGKDHEATFEAVIRQELKTQ